MTMWHCEERMLVPRWPRGTLNGSFSMRDQVNPKSLRAPAHSPGGVAGPSASKYGSTGKDRTQGIGSAMRSLLCIPGIHRSCSFPRGCFEEASQRHRWWVKLVLTDFWRAQNSLEHLWKTHFIKLDLLENWMEWKIVVDRWVYSLLHKNGHFAQLFHVDVEWKGCICVPETPASDPFIGLWLFWDYSVFGMLWIEGSSGQCFM